MHNILLQADIFKKQVTEDQITVYAAQASFFLVISAFPLLMLAMTMIQFVSPDSLEEMLATLTLVVPETFRPSLYNIVHEVYAKSSNTILSVTAVTTIWSASKGVMAVERGLNQVYSDEKPIGYIRLRLVCYFYTMFFMAALLLVLILLVFGNNIQLFLENRMPAIRDFSILVVGIRTFSSAFLLTGFFMLLYRFFPGRNVSLADQFPGAIFATFGWSVFSFVYSIYITKFSNFSYTYGSLTAIVLIMLWIYFCMTITLLGAEINVFLEHKSSGKQDSER